MHADRKKNSFVEFYARRILQSKTVRKGEKRIVRDGGGKSPFVLFRVRISGDVRLRLPRSFRFMPKLDYRPTVIVLQHLLVGGQGHVLGIVLLPIMFSTKFAKCSAKESDSAAKIDNRVFFVERLRFTYLGSSIADLFFLNRLFFLYFVNLSQFLLQIYDNFNLVYYSNVEINNILYCIIRFHW